MIDVVLLERCSSRYARVLVSRFSYLVFTVVCADACDVRTIIMDSYFFCDSYAALYILMSCISLLRNTYVPPQKLEVVIWLRNWRQSREYNASILNSSNGVTNEKRMWSRHANELLLARIVV